MNNHAIIPEVSVVIPCLDEADTIEACVTAAQHALRVGDIRGDVIVVDNGSVDDSASRARRRGARVVSVPERGYGTALLRGIEDSQATFVIIGDADGSYDFYEIPRFVTKLRAGYELVQGCRLPSGGGRIRPGAMSALHRWVGTPFLSWLVRVLFGAKIHDVNCGLRGFKRSFVAGLNLSCPGMEFASEMVVKVALAGGAIIEIPVTLHKDGRKVHSSHLRTFRDGCRHLRLYLVHVPYVVRSLFL